MKPVSGKRMCRILAKLGWQLIRIKGSHHAFQHPDNFTTIIVPVHGNKDLKPGTQHGIMKDAGLTEADL
jgi:predicted RNA binding protein YcfA (HicA-like mRNA interferase family)